MKHEYWVKYVIGENRLTAAFIFINLLKCTFLTYFYVDGPENQVGLAWNCCKDSIDHLCVLTYFHSYSFPVSSIYPLPAMQSLLVTCRLMEYKIGIILELISLWEVHRTGLIRFT